MRHPFGNPPFNISLHFGDKSPVEIYHTGTDFIGQNIAIFAMTKGRVLFTGVDPNYSNRGSGVKIEHPWIDGQWKFIIRYWHIEKPLVKANDWVEEGWLLGYSTNHLHLDIQIPDDGQGQSPLPTENNKYRFVDSPTFMEQFRLGEREKELTEWLNNANREKEDWHKWCQEWELTARKHGIDKPEFKCPQIDQCQEAGG